MLTPATTPQVFAWDTSTNAPDKDGGDGRSYISAISEVITDRNQTCRGTAKNDMGEARMDIEDSEMAYLGYHNGESYGLTWKVMQDAQKFCRSTTKCLSWLVTAVLDGPCDARGRLGEGRGGHNFMRRPKR